MISLSKKCSFIRNAHKFSTYILKKTFSEINNYCKILKIKENSTKDEVKVAYYKLVKSHHPDMKNTLDKSQNLISNHSEIQFYEIQNAYEQLILQIDQKEEKRKLNDSHNNIDDMIEVILKSGINSKNNKNENLKKKLKSDLLFSPLFGVKMDKEDILDLKQIIKSINYKINKKRIKRDEIRKQNEIINMNATNSKIDALTNKVPSNYNVNEESDPIHSLSTPSLTNIIFLKITKIVAITTISLFFIINFGVHIGCAISLYVIYLAII